MAKAVAKAEPGVAGPGGSPRERARGTARTGTRLDTGPVPWEQDCPVITGQAMAEYKASLRAAGDLSAAVLRFLEARPARQKAAWLRMSVEEGKVLFQPWSMEVLFVVAVLGRVRFNQLHELLGLSTRTLSDKLKALKEAGFLEREVFDEQPVRIEYALTRDGRRAAALATPLFTHLNLLALQRTGRLPARR